MVYANQGDVLKIVDLSTKKSHTRVIAAPGNNINILDLFPKQTRSITTGPRAVGGSSTPRGPINNDSKDKKLNRVLMIMIGILVPCVIGLVIYTFIDPATPTPPPPKPAGPVVTQPEPIDTNQSANTNVTNTTVVSGNLTNTVGTQNPRTTTTTATNPRSGTRTSPAQGAVRGGASNSQPAATCSRSQASTSNSSSTSKASKTECTECKRLTALREGTPSPTKKESYQKKINNHPTH